MKISGWGNYQVLDAHSDTFRYEEELRSQLLADQDPTLARGMGRSYGDASLNIRVTDCLQFSRIRAFDPQTGKITCEAGMVLDDLLDFLVPRGWFVPVTPGTKYVTLGGMLASDVHGKNHHLRGSFSQHVMAFTIMRGDGEIVTCTSTENSELFAATCGGMGLTGIILTISFQLIPISTSWISQRTLVADNLDEILTHFDEADTSTYSVAWIDCLAKGRHLGRSVLFTGEHIQASELTVRSNKPALQACRQSNLTVPVSLPGKTLNGLTVRAFNALYYGKAKWQSGENLIDLYSFFYPLDGIKNWNRIYGKNGFLQYQCVIPRHAGPDVLTNILETTSKAGKGSFLAVLKLLGKESCSMLGFPLPGYTLALDFPESPDLLDLLNILDAYVSEAGGRIYLTKDARMSAQFAAESYPQWQKFIEYRSLLPGANKFTSIQAQRLGLDSFSV